LHGTRLLAAAAARRATAVYVTSGSPPFDRVDGDVRRLEGMAVLTAQDVDALVLESAPEPIHDALRRGETCEWLIDDEQAGRVRCHSFRDYRGPGALFELLSTRPLSAEQLGIPAEAMALASESDGLIVIAAPRGQGRTTVAAAFLDAINVQRHCYAIALERQIRVVHESRNALVSQRELPGTGAQASSVARAALAERPDVLVMDDLQSIEMMQVMFDAIAGGALGFVTVDAPTTVAALQRIIELFPEARRNWVRSVLADRVRGAIAQALLRHTHGGRVAARELLLPTAAVRSALASGRTGDLPAALADGHRHGLVSLNESLLDLVRTGAVDIREAYRRADDREELVRALKRERVDLSRLDRLA
jgi:twitching motility protein PilT